MKGAENYIYGYTPFGFFIYICFVLKKQSVAAHSHVKNISVNDIILNTKSRQFHSNRVVDNKRSCSLSCYIHTYTHGCTYISNKERGYVVYINLLGSLEPRI